MFNYIIYYVALQTQSNVLNELFSAYQQHLAPPNVIKYISLPVAQIGQSTKYKTLSNVLIFHWKFAAPSSVPSGYFYHIFFTATLIFSNQR